MTDLPPADMKVHVDEYPEHEKLRAIADKSQAIGEFLDWLSLPAAEGGKGVVLTERACPHGYWPMEECKESRYCRRGEESVQFWPFRSSTTKLLAEFFKIDLDKIEEEKRAMLDAIRAANG